MKNAANRVIDKTERGQQPTKAELRAAGFCLDCEGFGFTRLDDDTELSCRKCGGTGEAAHKD